MTNAIYPKWEVALLSGDPGALLSGTVCATFVGRGYEFSPGHEFLADVSDVLARPSVLTGKTFDGGTFDAADTLFVGITGEREVSAIIIYVDNGSPSTSRLVLYLDEKIVGVPFVPSGGDVKIKWNSAGIFQPFKCSR